MLQITRCRHVAARGHTLSSLAALLALAGLAGAAHATDTTAPTSTLAHPVLNDHLGSLVIDGTASDSDSGVSTVTVRLQRAWGWSTEYWTGSTWSTTATNLTVSLDPANGTAPRDWQVTSALPSGTAFGTGQYTVWRQVKDVANNASAAQTVNFYSGTDGADPTVTLEPDENDIYPSFTDANGCIIRGTAQDTGGGAGANQSSLGRVQVRLYKNTSSVLYYWNGSAWSTNTANLQTSLSTPDANGQVSWQCTATMPAAEQMASVYYVIRIDAIDRSGNTVNISSNIGISPEDTVLPTVSVTSPTQNQYLTSLTQITGTASDTGTPSSGLARVDVRLRRVLNGVTQYWNGTTWTTNSSYLASRSELSWIRNTSLPSGANLPSGAYSILAAAYDNYGNASPQVTRAFFINQRPVAQPQTVTLSGHHGRPGENRSLTLAATDAENDTLTYEVLATPQHGTLAGTAPNLIYTPDADYFGADSFTFRASDAGGASNTATVSLNVAVPPPVDVLIKNSADVDYTGDDITGTDGANQTVGQTIFAGAKATYLVKVQKDAAEDSLVLKVAGTAESNGWMVRYFDAHTNGLDITEAVTGEDGWHPMLGGTDKNFRVEVTPPGGLTQDGQLALLISAEREDTPNTLDAVKAVTTAHPNGQPDVTIRRAIRDDEIMLEQDWEGGGESQGFTYAGETTTYGLALKYEFQVKNSGTVATRYAVNYRTSSEGWTTWLDNNTPALEGQPQPVIPVFELPAGTSRTFVLWVRPESNAAEHFTPSIQAVALDADGQPTGQADALAALCNLQYVAGIEWSLDGETWAAVPATPLETYQYQSLGLRAVKGVSGVGWPDSVQLLPRWQRSGTLSIELPGDEAWFQFADATAPETPETIAVTCGVTKSVSVKVLPPAP